MRRTIGAALSLLALVSSGMRAQSRADTVVLRIEGPTEQPTRFSGTIRLRGGQEERRYNDMRTPFEIRLPAQALEARFAASFGTPLSGTMTLHREGKQVGWVTGTSRLGGLRFHRSESGAFGFGSAIGGTRSLER